MTLQSNNYRGSPHGSTSRTGSVTESLRLTEDFLDKDRQLGSGCGRQTKRQRWVASLIGVPASRADSKLIIESFLDLH